MTDVRKHSSTPPIYGIVGDGRVARHMSHYLSLVDLQVQRWSRRTGYDLAAALADAEVVLILIRDGAIADFVDRHDAFLSDRTAVHFSGTVTVSGIAGMHPLCTFGPDLYDLETYTSVPFICEADGPPFAQAFPTLPNRSFVIPGDRKPLYHAAAVLAGNFSAALWLKLFQTLEELGIPADAAHAYLERFCRNLIELPAEHVLTGPVVRRDTRTIEENLRALSDDPYAAVYRAFVETLAPDLAGEMP